MAFLTNLSQKYQEFLDRGDPRVESWPLMSSPFPSLFILLAYFVVVYKGPAVMADRKPFELKSVLLAYNLGMVVMCVYMSKEFALSGWLTGYSLGCQPVDYSASGERMVLVCYMFFISKFIELLDTVFFIARKKFSQVTFLHVFHHGFLPFNWWFGIKFVPGGFGSFHAFVNAVIHSVMYLYYFLSVMGPSVRKYLWWKKYLTTLQITQFFIVLGHTGQIFFFKDCAYRPIFAYAIFGYTFCFLLLFLDFYRKSYKQRATKPSFNSEHSNGHIQNGEIHHKED